MLSLSFLAAAALAPSVPAAGAPTVPADAFAIRARVVHVGDGTSLENAVVVVRDGKVASVGGQAPDGVTLIEVDGHLAPGFIGLRESVGARGENAETTRKITPTAELVRAFDPEHPDWQHLVEQGITAVAITPSSSRIAGGVAPLVSPATGEVLARRALVCLGLSSRSLENDVEPTSYAGLFAHLEQAFAEAAADSPLALARAGRMPVLMEAVSNAEVANAAYFAQEMGLKGALLGAPRAWEVVDIVRESGLAVVFEPMAPGAPAHVTRSALALEKAQVPFAFTADVAGRGPAAMRMTAAAMQRAGVAPATVLAAMTRNAAEIAGVAATHGTIAAGKAADLVVWSGPPTDLTSRVQHVFAGGQHVLDATSDAGATR